MSQHDTAKIGGLSEPGEYDESMLALLQIIWGDGFLSPGGSEEIARLLEGSSIAGCSVLDIGCGLGAIDELLVHEHGDVYARDEAVYWGFSHASLDRLGMDHINLYLIHWPVRAGEGFVEQADEQPCVTGARLRSGEPGIVGEVAAVDGPTERRPL